MSRKKLVLRVAVKALSSLLCKVDGDQLSKVPSTGPLIIAANHVNFLDAPVVYTRLHPRPAAHLLLQRFGSSYEPTCLVWPRRLPSSESLRNKGVQERSKASQR